MNEIDKIIQDSSRKEIIEFLSDENNDFTSLIVCFQDKTSFGYKYLSGSSLATLTGLLRVMEDYFRVSAANMLDGDDAEDE